MSLSARRAWIEILILVVNLVCFAVALRKESVDRNKYVVQCRKILGVSLSARRAWIEIGNSSNMWCSAEVALRKESVDRNTVLAVSRA